MNRNKWKSSHDEKLTNLLGMKYQTARSQLERKFILYLCKKCNMGNCFQCGFPIETMEDMSIEHKTAWGGNFAKDIQSNIKLFWDMENIALSHKWCNLSAGSGGGGKYKYVGVHDFIDKRHNPPYHYIRSIINAGSKEMVLGCYFDEESAAIAYDLGAMFYRNGITRLNFPDLRDKYFEILKDMKSLHVKKIKELVNILKPMIIKEEELAYETIKN